MDRNSPLNKKIGNAWITYRSGQNASAIKEFESILNEDNDHIDALYGLGLVLRSSGDLDGARTNWQKGLDLANANLESYGDSRSLERERTFMTSTMLKQRLKELDS